MRRQAFTWLAILTGIVATIAVAEHLASRRKCEKCGAEMLPFRHGDPDWEGTAVLECPSCGWLVNT